MGAVAGVKVLQVDADPAVVWPRQTRLTHPHLPLACEVTSGTSRHLLVPAFLFHIKYLAAKVLV